MGCGDFNSFNTTINSNNNSDEPILLELYMNYPIENGYYKINFPDNSPHSYTSVEYQTEGMRRIYWTSLDSFTIVHMGYLITEPIINYSTYSRDDGSGKQMIYLDQDFINDTLMIRGCISESNCEELEFIIY
jgi:hypothetical protein